LDPDKRQALLAAAAEEFARQGWEGASVNRVIERSGLSKGVVYYYFEDKDDLYATALQEAIRLVAQAVGDLPPIEGPEQFWQANADLYGRVLEFLRREPTLVGLARSFIRAGTALRGSGPVAVLYQQMRAWFRDLLREGQRVGAVRTDLPLDLLDEIFNGMGEATDVWVVANWETALPGRERQVAAMIVKLCRRLLAPDELVFPPKGEGERAQASGGLSKGNQRLVRKGAKS
jgi:AcrR family transcriptional regulator